MQVLDLLVAAPLDGTSVRSAPGLVQLKLQASPGWLDPCDSRLNSNLSTFTGCLENQDRILELFSEAARVPKTRLLLIWQTLWCHIPLTGSSALKGTPSSTKWRKEVPPESCDLSQAVWKDITWPRVRWLLAPHLWIPLGAARLPAGQLSFVFQPVNTTTRFGSINQGDCNNLHISIRDN